MNDQSMNNNGASQAPAQQPENNAPQQVENENAQTQDREQSAPPVRTIRDGSISASVWERQSDDGPGYSAKVVRKWRDENGQFHESNNYSEYDLPRLADVARNTSDVINGLKQGRTHTQSHAKNENPEKTRYVEERQQQGQNPQERSRNRGQSLT